MQGMGRTLPIVAAAAAFALVALASFFPDARLWGINHLSYFPSSLRWMFLVLIGLCFLPAFARPLVDGFLSIVQLLCRRDRKGMLLVLLLGLVAVGVFWGLRSGTFLLGDGHLLARSYSAAQSGDNTLVISNAKFILQSERIAMGTSLLYLWSGKIAESLWGASWVDGIRMFNCILGGIFVIILLGVARSSGWSPTTRLWLLVLVLFSAFMQLFFGYMENYTPLMLCLLLYAVAAVRALNYRGSLLWPLLAQFLAILLHVQAIVLLPSLVYLFSWRRTDHPETFVERRLPLILAAAMLVGLVVVRFTPLQHFLLTFLPEDGGQAVLTLGHGLDVANLLLLVLPAALLFLGLRWLLGRESGWLRAIRPLDPASSARPEHDSRRSSRSRRSRQSPTTTASHRPEVPVHWLQTRAEWQFFQLQGWGCLLYLVFFEAAIGVARDWDLFAMIAVSLIPLSLILWNRYSQHTEATIDGSRDAVFIAPMLALTLILGMSWTLLNHSVPHTTRRFEGILRWETAEVPYAMEALAATYYDNGRVGDAIRTMEAAVVLSPNARLRSLLGTYFYEAGNYARARQLLEEQLRRNPKDLKVRNWLVRTLRGQQDRQEQERVLRQGIALHPQETRLHLLLGEILMELDRGEEGLVELRLGLQGNMPDAARQHTNRMIRHYEAQKAAQP
jgi:tetratricopeptide (TPR) repeat protein